MKNGKLRDRGQFFSQISPHLKPDTIHKIHTPTVEFSDIGSGFKARMLVKCACSLHVSRSVPSCTKATPLETQKAFVYFRVVRISCRNPRNCGKKINESAYCEMDLGIFRSLQFKQKKKMELKTRSERGVDSNHRPQELKSFDYRLTHEESDDFRWSKSLFIFQMILSVYVGHQPGVQGPNYEENALF